MAMFKLTRKKPNAQSTIGVLEHEDSHFCYVLEDTVRPAGVKVVGNTAIPAGIYELDIEYSPRFKRRMATIKNVPMFTGIRFHGGNDHGDTEGCPLLAAETDWSRVWNCTEVNQEFITLVQSAIEDGKRPMIDIIDEIQGVFDA